MSSQNIVSEYGYQDIEVPAGQYISVAYYGADNCNVLYGNKKTVSTDPVEYGLLATITNNEVVYGGYSVNKFFRIEAGAFQAFYKVGTAPLAITPQRQRINSHRFFDDFDTFNTADWTITTTEAGAGSATEALGNVDGGVLVITNDDASGDADFFQKVGESFKFESGKKLWFESRFKIDNATNSAVVMGLQITDTTPLDVTDGVFFLKSSGDTKFDFLVEKNNTATTTSEVFTLVDDTFCTLGFHYNGSDKVDIYANGLLVGTSVTTNLPDDEELTISFGVQNGSAVSRVMTLDYILAEKAR